MARPCCPQDHPGVEMQPTGDREMWICSISGAHFRVTFQGDTQEVKQLIDTSGNLKYNYSAVRADGGYGG